ncbi:Na+/proline symporter [Catalinimonas alkaloidigena]|uniref:Na+/proline symporter n=1 Tax=Catalinimonas alkaloidigena TaxID=1075417 RepID=A0A1G9KB06_9BACT|nr:sodium:solute symporter family protein [Catalinimonas alkaloidigena]SDL46473.1 Na+/proline symporter [Catalinimonas alkaloidigena]
MLLSTFDWIIIFAFFVISLGIGLYAARTAGSSAAEFFLSGRNMPWWLLGVSMVATTFSCDTPNLVTDIVRQSGVAGNWAWWAFLLTGMLTVFLFAKLWRRSDVMTDLEFYELRYSGEMAAFLRGFRAIYLGVFFNVIVMATVCLAVIKIGAVMLQWPAWLTLAVVMTITAIYSSIGGLKGVLLTDFFQFFMAMIGSIGAAFILTQLPEVGSVSEMLSHPQVMPKLNMLPDFADTDALLSLLILPLAVQWWSVWYPGAEPGGGGYIAQRMLSAKNEKGAVGATLLFNATHYALRPWPWILVALASIVVFPTVESMREAFPNVNPNLVQNDFAYPAMLSFLPSGFLGLVVASLIAAFMSTISTQVNWGSSYIVNDFYQRFVNPQATDKQLVAVGRWSTVLLVVVTSLFALLLSNALQGFNILLQVGAGTGLIFILRWFWWRINAYTELAGMLISFVVAVYLEVLHADYLGFPPLTFTAKLLLGVGITTVGWIIVTYLTRPTDQETLFKFYQKVHPGGPGWQPVLDAAAREGKSLELNSQRPWDVPRALLCMMVGAFAIYSALFATGNWIYGNFTLALSLTVACGASVYLLMRLWTRLEMDQESA